MIIYLITGFLEQSVLVIYVTYIKFLHLFHIYIYIFFFSWEMQEKENLAVLPNLELLHDDDDNDNNNNHHHHITITMNTVKWN